MVTAWLWWVARRAGWTLVHLWGSVTTPGNEVRIWLPQHLVLYGNDMAPDQTIFDKLLLISDLLQRDMNSSFAGTPLTASRVGVLWMVHHLGPSTQQSIAAGLGVSARHVSGLVDVLEKHGYVRRQAHPTDRRAVIVALTASARLLVAEMQRQHEAVTADLVSCVAEEDRAALDRGIDAIAARLTTLVTESEVQAPQDVGRDGTADV